MMQSTHAELREAAARGAMPTRWATAGTSSRPPPCTADRHHHWSEERADDALNALYGTEYVEACGACGMRRIRLDAGGPGCDTAYAPGIEYKIWAVSYRACGYARAGGAGGRRGGAVQS